MDTGLDLSGLESLKGGLQTVADTAAQIEDGINTIKEIGASVGLWDPPAGEKPGRWAFVASNRYPGRKRREGDTFTAADGSVYGWAYLYNSDLWESGANVGQVPAWVPLVQRGPLSRQTGLLRRLWKAGARNSDIERIAALDPLKGIGKEGDTFDTLSDARKRAYLANAAIIAAVEWRADPVKFAEAWGQIVAKQVELGWCQYPNDPNCSQTMKAPGVSLDGRPITLLANDFTSAAKRAILVARGTGDLLSVWGEGEADKPVAAEAWKACLTDKPLPERRACLDAALTATPSIQTALDNYPDPWRPFSDPADGFQWIKGVDGAHYAKLGTGDAPIVLRGEIAIGLSALIVVTVAGVGYALARVLLKK